MTEEKDVAAPETRPPARIQFMKEAPEEPAGEPPKEVDLKEEIARKIREDCQKLGLLTAEEALVALAGRAQAVSDALAQMAKEPSYADIKAVTTASGLVFFYSEKYMKVAEAASKSLLEEVKFRIAGRVRADSAERESLTPVAALYDEIGWDVSAYDPAEIGRDPRYEDIKTVSSPAGERFFYSERFMSGYYATVLGRAAGKDPCLTIAETVRDESRLYPRPTRLSLFQEKAFGIEGEDLKAILERLQSREEFKDIKVMTHPETGGVYLYSDRYLNYEVAWGIMDWEEVGRDANP